MKTSFARFGVAGVATALALVAVAFASLSASAEVTFHQTIATGYPVYNSCAGELVDLTGNIDNLETTTFDSNGGIHVAVQTNFAGVSGVGETSGIKYQATGHGGSVMELRQPFPVTFTNSSYQQMISQGSAPNFVFVFKSHETVNADGAVTATFDKVDFGSCK